MKLLAFLTALPGVFSWLQLTGLKGGSLSIPCIYDMKYRNHMKYWCRGPSWIFCSILKKSITQQRDTDSLLISDNKSQHVFTVTMRGLKMDDEDWYWCAIEIQNSGDDGYALKLTITDDKSRPAMPALNTLLLNIKSQRVGVKQKVGSALLMSTVIFLQTGELNRFKGIEETQNVFNCSAAKCIPASKYIYYVSFLNRSFLSDIFFK